MAVFLDTNVLIYSISTAPQEVGKQARALALLDQQDCVLSVQVLQEFYVQATRPSRVDPLPHATASALIDKWRRFQVQDNTMAVLLDALEIRDRNKISYWDSAIVAAARLAGCEAVYSEDLGHGQSISGVRIINPFRDT